MKQNYILIIIICLIPILGCEKMVSVGPPRHQLISDVVFENDDHAIAVMTGIYSAMYQSQSNSYYIPLICGVAGDELRNWTTESSIVQVYENILEPINAISNRFWNNGYNFIYRANAVIDGCENSSLLTANTKKQLSSEAAFTRAFWYFYLVNFFGDVPVLTTTDYRVNAIAPRNTITEVYAQIIEDLTFAAENLNREYIDIKGNPYDERVRPNKFAAIALRARAYLYTRNWANAIESASEVINETILYDTVSVDEAFLKNNKEAIWQILNPVSVANKATNEGRLFILASRPFSTTTLNCTTLSDHLMDAFETGDKRYENWVGTFEDVSTTPSELFPFPYKYKESSTPTPNEYSIFMRLAEQYLIRAEAFAQLGDIDNSLNDLNLIRKRAGLDPVVASNANELLDLIAQERRVELFAEMGHRWLDLKRWGKIDEVMQVVAPTKGTTWNTNMQWWPIPQQDIESNPNLEQNIGYN